MTEKENSPKLPRKASTSKTTQEKAKVAKPKSASTKTSTAKTRAKTSKIEEENINTPKASPKKAIAKKPTAKKTPKKAENTEEKVLSSAPINNEENLKLNINAGGELESTENTNSAHSNNNSNNTDNLPPVYASSEEASKVPAENTDPYLSEISQEPEEAEETIEPMTLLDHLKELRIRLTRIVIVVLIGFFACYAISELAYNFLTEPLTSNMPANASLIYTSPPGLFFVYLKVAFVLSFFVSSPYTFYQLWAFVAPGLYTEEKKVLIPLALISAFFFIAGAAFCYFMVLPIAFKFFMGFATATITPMISVEEYLTFVLKLLIAFGVVFEMPLFSFFLARMGLVTAKKMRAWRKYSILMMFITAALLTPPDVFSQTLMAMPMILLYEISILIAQMVEKEKSTEKDKSKTKVETKQ